jgi:hypothetical protein
LRKKEMPVILNIHLSLKTGEVLRREGVRGHSLRPEIKNLILELMASVKEVNLLEPAVAYEIYSITEMSHSQVVLKGNAVVFGSLLPSLLPEAKELVVAVGTIGPRLEEQVTEYYKQDEPLRAVLLDGIGSAAVDSLTQEACKRIEIEASSRGYQVSSPINPGMPGLSLTEQWQLFDLVPAGEIGVSLTSSGVMVPRKSTSMVIGMGPQMATWTRAEVCARCYLRKTCPYKIQA